MVSSFDIHIVMHIMKKLSIIIPAYNSEKYIKKCVDSVLKQTYNNIEIIIVDDGSSDRTNEICHKMMNEDKRIFLITQQNSGSSSARNTGIEVATGDYITFVDSDDWIDEELYEKVIGKLEKDDADMVIFGITCFSSKIKNKTVRPEDNIIDNSNIEKQLIKIIRNDLYGYAWNKVYKSDLIKKMKIQFPCEIKKQEDLIFNLNILPYIKKISLSNETGYHYIQREDSLIHSKEFEGLNNIRNYCEYIVDINIKDNVLKKNIVNYSIKHYISDFIIYEILWNDKIEKVEKKQLMKKIFGDDYYNKLLSKDNNDPTYLKMLYKSFEKNNYRFFYGYFLLSELKRKIL